MKRKIILVILSMFYIFVQSQISIDEINSVIEEAEKGDANGTVESTTEGFSVTENRNSGPCNCQNKSSVTQKPLSLDPYQFVNSSSVTCKFECVPFYQCNNGIINVNGETLIDIRQNDGPCGNAFLACCQQEHLVAQSTTPTPEAFIPKGCGYRNPDGVGFKITGTKDNEAQFAEFPWVVSVKREAGTAKDKPKGGCGGALIHPQAVITAAHCVSQTNERYIVRAGEWDISKTIEPFPYQETYVKTITIHEKYYSGALFNDIAFLYLEQPFTNSENVNTVCLPPQNYQHRPTRCFSTGWGKNATKGNFHDILKKVDLPFVPRDTCEEQLRQTRLGRFFQLHSSFMCAGGEIGKDSCKGDGGSPLVCPLEGEGWRYYHAGIVSWGIGCGDENTPGVYADVAQFRDWIDDKMFKFNLNSTFYDQNIGLEPRLKPKEGEKM